MHKYILYGLGVHTEISLWGHEIADCPRDVNVHWLPGGFTQLEGAQDRLWEIIHDREIRLSWPEVVTMSIRNGDEIVIETPGQDEPNYVRHLISGLGMGLILHQRGVFTLHASAVDLGGSAIGIAGPKRSGKSTTAGVLSGWGYQLLSDDVLAVDMRDSEEPRVLPGLRTLNLWPDSVLALGQDLDSLPKIWSDGNKRVAPVAGTPAHNEFPLRCIFFLDPSDTDQRPRLVRLSPAEAVQMLVGNSHALRLVEDRQAMPFHLAQSVKLANSVDLFRLKRPMSIDSIEAVASLIEKQVTPHRRRVAR